MTVVRTIAECRVERAKLGNLALVPTMGALHRGHLSLVEYAKNSAPYTAVSIFVNPTQFGPREDFHKYPRPLEADLAKCREMGVDLVFNPSVEEMYPPQLSPMVIDLPHLTEVLEGKHRPGHFKGVCQVVAKLFNIVQPQMALFGQKDFQQLRVLTAMVEALDWPIEVIGCETIREQDGLAMSSRNQYLSLDERERALAISRALLLANGEVKEGERRANRLLASIQNTLLEVGQLGRVPVSIDYIAAVDPITLKHVNMITGPTVLAIAVRVGNTRLIDNIVVTPTGTS
ncbi:MAG TPA: pantoate--beta-alanine ligase [Tepidisphaeraceae bacterium]|jgi:pantoate--beta-alanine ligase|nr:pantoate--beta-alanine ligase [Tepidisphaeraceae bacterium]